MADRKTSSSAGARKTFKPRRGRPTAAQASAITGAILNAARELFLRHGFEAASMDAIARQAGVPRSTLYKRFADKATLLEAVVQERIARWATLGTHIKPPGRPAELDQRLENQLKSVLAWFADDEVRAFTRLALGTGEGARLVSQVLRDVGYAAVVSNIEADIRAWSQEAGEAVKDPHSVAVVLMSMLTGWIAARPPDEPIPRKEANTFVDRAVELLVSGRQGW